MTKKQDKPIGYRPKGEIKAFLDDVAYKGSPIAKTRIIDMAMRLLLEDKTQCSALRALAGTQPKKKHKGSRINSSPPLSEKGTIIRLFKYSHSDNGGG